MGQRMENLILWKYLEQEYGVGISFSDSGYEIRYNGTTFDDGDVSLGLTKARIGLPQNKRELAKYKLSALSVIQRLLSSHFKTDALLQAKFETAQVTARRTRQHG